MAGGLALERRAMHRARGGLGAEQISRSDLYAGRTERHGSRNAFRVGDANDPSPPAFDTATASALPCTPAMGA